MFILSVNAIKALNETPGIKPKLALELGLSENSINRLIRDNQPNGDLTKHAALELIRKETELVDIDKVLEYVEERVPQT